MKRVILVAAIVILALGWRANAAELPDAFPGDIPVADYMAVTSSTQVGDDLMVDFHAPGQTMDGVAEWLIANLTAAGWNNSDDTGSSRSRILVFTKGDRRCGVMVTNFVMSPSMQMDETIKGVQMQISGGSDNSQEGATATSMSADEGETN